MSPELIALWVFLAVALGIFAMVSLSRDIKNSDPKRMKKRLEEEFAPHKANATLFKNLSEMGPDPFAEEQEQRSLIERLRFLIEQSGVHTTAEKVLLKSSLMGFGFGLLVLLITTRWEIGLVLGLAAAAIPISAIWVTRNKRLDQLRSQLPAVFGFMARVLRAGQTASQAIELVSDEFEDPVAGEFSYCHEQLNLGLSMDTVLRDLARRTAILEIKMFVVATIVQRESGGNLSEMLDNLAKVMRERFRVRSVVSSLTAEGRMQAAALLALPFVLFCLLFVMKPDLFGVILHYPWVIFCAFISELIGAFWIRRIIDFDY